MDYASRQSKDSRTLARYIYRACDPYNFEPNLALNLEIADFINQKKGNFPRESAFLIVQQINDRNPTTAMLALHLLDILVKNCGYPFHLQIATKEFLNELVRRFPERPPPRPSRIQLKILEMIHQWHSTICETSRYKDDLGFIRDMHRLLSYKGYKFPEVQEDSAAVLNPSDSLKSAEELEEEDRSANAAKLQELIRRGTTHDLQEANRLMKLMAGYDQSRKTDYRAKAAQDLEKVRRKATLLGEMLAGVKAGDKVGNGDIYEEMAAQIRTAQPKIQKMCQEESDDQEAVNKMLALNDLINTLDEQYHALRDGDYARAEEIKARVPKDITSAPRDIGGSQSLIDMEFGLGGASEGAPESTGSPDTSAGAPAGAPTAQASENHSDDLLGLSFTDDASQNNPFGMGGSISLGGGAAANSNALGNLTSSSGTVSPQPAQQASQPRGPNYSALEGLSNLSLGSSTSPRATSPSAPAGTNAFDNLGSLFGSSSGTTPQSRSPAPPMAAPATSSGAMQMGDFMSGFGSAPSAAETTIFQSSWLLAKIHVVRAEGTGYMLVAKFSNASASDAISDLWFQMAVPRTMTLQMQPQSGRDLAPRQTDGISQTMTVGGVVDKAAGVRIRWKISCRHQGRAVEETGDAVVAVY